jgi:hypothetical protein
MDKSWMILPRNCRAYQNGVDSFLRFAMNNASLNGKILCPCVKCGNGIMRTDIEAREHLIVYGFIKGYSHWIVHGELSLQTSSRTNLGSNFQGDNSQVDDMDGLLHDAFGIPSHDDFEGVENSPGAEFLNSEAENFYKLINDSQQELYPGCKKFSKLSFLIRLLHLKCAGKWSNRHFDMLLDLLRESFPDAEIPKSYYEAEKTMKQLGLGYEKIDACPNDCTLYWGDKLDWKYCFTCKESRWVISENDPIGEKRKVAKKVIWYFPLKPRLQRLFMSSKTAKSMRWHGEVRVDDGVMRHPADTPTWKNFDYQHPQFSKDVRNVRLGLASDGFNPFKNMNVAHSTWPVILTPYNLPPWMCMKQPYFILSLLISGPTAPGNNLDVYLEPLIAELKELWDVGMPTYDAYSKQNFQMRAALLWTISDFPGYANLSGWSTKGEFACPICHKDTDSQWLKNSGKHCYLGHRRFLEPDHPFRKDAISFNGKQEHRLRPDILSGDMVLREVSGTNFKFGKLVNDNEKFPFNWKKKSAFFGLSYWKDILIRHNLDVMHIEKNVSEMICAILLEMDKKREQKSRLDLKDMNIRPELHPVEKENGASSLPRAAYVLSKIEKLNFCRLLKRVKVPDGYSANLSRCVQLRPPKISGLKSHDHHVLMQQLLPIALRKVLPRSVRYPLLRLSRYFRLLCSKELVPRDLVQLEMDIAVILCEMERVFPPSAFNITMHLCIHLAYEARMAGPVQFRWMYPIERYVLYFEVFVRKWLFLAVLVNAHVLIVFMVSGTCRL